MTLGLGTLTALRQFLLGPVAARPQATNIAPDATVQGLGLGVAALFEKYCARQFERDEAATVKFSGDRLTFVLPLYPVEAITKVETQDSFGDEWVECEPSDLIASFDEASGLIQFKAMPTTEFGRVRITWAGGFWVADDDQDEDDLPEGATPLPPDLQLTWLNCCQEFWNKRDKLGLSLTSAPDAKVAIAKLELPAGTKALLNPHRRMQLS